MLANTLTQVWSCKICRLLSSRFGSLWQLYTVYTECWLNSPKTHTLKICLCRFSGFLLYFILDYQTSTKIEVSVYFRNPLRNSSILMPLKIFARKWEISRFSSCSEELAKHFDIFAKILHFYPSRKSRNKTQILLASFHFLMQFFFMNQHLHFLLKFCMYFCKKENVF